MADGAGSQVVSARSLSLRANVIAITGGRVLAAAAQWVALIVVAKASDIETTGQFALAQVICIPIAEIARMGLRDVQATDVDRGHAFHEYLGLRVLSAAVGLMAMVLVGAAAADSPSVFLVIVVYAGSRVVELLSDITYGLFQLQGRLDFIGRSLGLVALTSVAFLAVGFVLTGSLIVAVAGQLVAYLLVFVFHDLAVARRRIRLEDDSRIRPGFQRPALASLARVAVPLGIASVFAIVAIELPRVLVAADLGTESLGIFAPLFVLAMAPSRFVNSLGTAATTPLAALHVAGDRRPFVLMLARLAAAAGAVGIVGVVVAAGAGEWIMRTVYTSAYEEHADVFLLLVIAGALRFEAVLLQYGIIAARRFWWLTATTVLVALVAVAAAFTLVPRGLEGAGVAVVIVFSSHLAIVVFAVTRVLPRRPTPSASSGPAEIRVDE